MKSPAMLVISLEVFANTIKMEPELWMWLACLHVEETKIIQEGTHLLQQVQTFGSHGISGVFGWVFKLMGFQFRLGLAGG